MEYISHLKSLHSVLNIIDQPSAVFDEKKELVCCNDLLLNELGFDLCTQPELENADVLDATDIRILESDTSNLFVQCNDSITQYKVLKRDTLPVEGKTVEVIQLQQNSIHSYTNETPNANQNYKYAFEVLHEGIIICDTSLDIVSANTSAGTILGISSDELKQMNIASFADKVFKHGTSETYSFDTLPIIRAIRQGVSTKGAVLSLKQPDESFTHLLINSLPIYHQGAKHPHLAVASFVDITHQLKSDEALRKSEELHRLLTECSSDVISKHRNDTVCLYISPACEAILGYKPNDLTSKPFTDFIHPDDIEDVRNKFSSIKSSQTLVITYRFKNKVGMYYNIESTLTPVESSDDKMNDQLVLISRDISSRIQMENALRESEMRYRSLFDHASDAIYIHDLFGRFIEVNSIACKRLGYTKEELLTLEPADIQMPKYAALIPERMSTLLRDHKLVYETVHVHKNGSLFPVELNLRLIEYDGKRVVISIERDITERKEFETELEKSLALLQATIESIADGILVVSNNGDLITFNRRFEEIWDLPSHWSSIESRDKRLSLLRGKVKSPKDFMFQIDQLYQDIDATSYDILEFYNGRFYERYSFPFKTGEKVVGRAWSFRDITERRNAEEELRQNRSRLKAIFDNAGVAIGLLDAQGHFALINDRWADLFGVEPAEVYKRDALSFTHPDDKNLSKKNLEEVLQRRSQGYRIEKRYINEKNEMIWGDLSVTPINDNEGNLEGVLGVITEISQRKKAEQELHKINLELSKRNEELDAFAHTVAHDLKNPLGIILGYGKLLEDHRIDLSSEDLTGIFQGITTSAQKMNEIIESILLLARIRIQEIERSPLDMRKIVLEALKHMNHIVEQSNAEIQIAESFPTAMGYRPWVEEVWANYITNALKYGGRPPKITIDSEPTQNGDIKFFITDNGAGISDKNRKKLFNKFTRLNAFRGEGQGLGLSIVKRIVEKLGGEVGVESNVGSGSTFYFTLPTSTDSSD